MGNRIGFIGLGNMGRPMAKNLLRAGFDLTVYDLVPEAVKALTDEGARSAASAGDAAEGADFLITILPKDAHIVEVYTAPGGVLERMGDGGVCIEMTSALGQTVVDMQNRAVELGRKIDFLDAPVSGGVAGAENAALTIMCGGTPEVFERSKPVLEAMGKKIFYTGDVGSGKSVKMVNQLLNAGNTLVAAEAIFLAKRLGLDLDLFCGIVKESSGNSWIFENNVPKFMIPRKYDSGFRLDLIKKDIGLSMDKITQDGLSMPLSTLVYQIYQSMENQGHGGQNYNVMGEWIEQQNPNKL